MSLSVGMSRLARRAQACSSVRRANMWMDHRSVFHLNSLAIRNTSSLSCPPLRAMANSTKALQRQHTTVPALAIRGVQTMPSAVGAAATTTPTPTAKTTPYMPYVTPAKGILSKLPPSWVPFAELSRIEKPGGLYGFYMAYVIGLGYGACILGPAVSPTSIVSTGVVLLVYNVFLRGAACTVNDILDREYDRKVARCCNRPVARRAVTPAQGYAWYAAQTVGAGAAIACLPDPLLALAYAVPIQLVVSLYPFCKRFTDFPQLVLSAPIAGGVLMAAASIGLDCFDTASPAIAGATLTLTLSHYIWTTIFDYVNACQDTPDDVKAGVRSMAVRYQNTVAFISTLGAGQVACLAATGYLAGFSPLYYTLAVGGNALWLSVMARTAKRSRPDLCAWWFAWGGLLVSGTTGIGLFAEYWYEHRRTTDQAEVEAVKE